MNTQEQLDAIKDIRNMMNRSVRFISLSGLSGVFAGIYATIAGILAYQHIGGTFNYARYSTYENEFFIFLGTATLAITIITAFYFTYRKASKNGIKLWDNTAKLAFVNLAIPLFTGGIFCLGLMYHQLYGMLAPATLLFYGLALVNVSKHTFPQVRQLGILELILGLVNVFFIGYGLIFWVIGFGLLHIVYGILMHYKYDRK